MERKKNREYEPAVMLYNILDFLNTAEIYEKFLNLEDELKKLLGEKYNPKFDFEKMKNEFSKYLGILMIAEISLGTYLLENGEDKEVKEIYYLVEKWRENMNRKSRYYDIDSENKKIYT